jgi:hypothetical protein
MHTLKAMQKSISCSGRGLKKQVSNAHVIKCFGFFEIALSIKQTLGNI